MTSKLFRWVRWLFAASMLLLLGWVLVSDFGDIATAKTLGVRFGFAVLFGVAGLFAASISWSSLVGTRIRDGLAAFGSTLPVRHLPLGGLGQVLGLAGVAKLSGVESGMLLRATPLFMLATASGASVVGLPVVATAGSPWWIRAVVVAVFVSTILVASLGSRMFASLPARWVSSVSFDRQSFLVAVGWSAIAALAAAIAFSLIFPFAPSLIDAIAGWSAAWLCGFVFVIAPAGLGAREAAMVALWPESAASTVIAAALTHRLSTFGAEVVLFLISWRLTKSWEVAINDVEVE